MAQDMLPHDSGQTADTEPAKSIVYPYDIMNLKPGPPNYELGCWMHLKTEPVQTPTVRIDFNHLYALRRISKIFEFPGRPQIVLRYFTASLLRWSFL